MRWGPWKHRRKHASGSAGLASLVIKMAFLGDVVLTTPLLEALARRHGPVDVVTTPAAATLVETHPAVRRVIPYDKRGKDRGLGRLVVRNQDRKSTRLNSSHSQISYAVFC